MTDEKAAAEIAVGVGTLEQPNGDVYVGLTVTTMFNEYVVGLTPQMAEELAKALPEGLRNGAKQAREQAATAARRKSGITIPGDVGFIAPR